MLRLLFLGEFAAAIASSGAQGRLGGGGLVSDLAALVVNSEGAVEALLELDAAAGVATAAWARWYLDEPFLKADGVVVGDGA